MCTNAVACVLLYKCNHEKAREWYCNVWCKHDNSSANKWKSTSHTCRKARSIVPHFLIKWLIDKFIVFEYLITIIISQISNFKNTLYSCCDCKWLILLQAPYRNLEDRILQVNPIMEAFGNARTGINANSSRFGKYLDLTMTRTGKVTGARVSVYLLEQSRVSQQAQ